MKLIVLRHAIQGCLVPSQDCATTTPLWVRTLPSPPKGDPGPLRCCPPLPPRQTPVPGPWPPPVGGDFASCIFCLVPHTLSCQVNVMKIASWFCVLDSGTTSVGLGLEWDSLGTSGSCQHHDSHTEALGFLIDDTEVYPWPSSFAAY